MQSMEEIYRQHAQTVYRYLLAQTRSADLAEELTQEAVLDSLRAGRFYASQGPRMETEWDGEVLRVRCSPAQMVVFYSDLVYSGQRVAKGFGITVSVLGAVLLVVLAFVVAKRNYLPIQYLLNTVKDSDKELEQSDVMDELGDLEVYVKKTIRTRQEMKEKIRQ